MAEMGKPESPREAKRNIVRAVKRVAEHLGNTPSVCRACYIHPAVLDSYCAGMTIEDARPRRRTAGIQPEYSPEEIALNRLLAERAS